MSGYYWPQIVALAPDKTVWVKGWEAFDTEDPAVRRFIAVE